MNDIKRLLASFIFTSVCIAALLFAGCSLPIGSLQTEPGANVASNYIKAVPKRSSYNVNDFFKPAEDLEVVGSFGGVSVSLSVGQLLIKIIGDPASGDEVICVQQGYAFKTAGTKTIAVSLGAIEDRYNVEVKAVGTGGGTDTGIVIIWPD
jgi:hypothetical protein